jgi:hypothetical protein
MSRLPPRGRYFTHEPRERTSGEPGRMTSTAGGG